MYRKHHTKGIVLSNQIVGDESALIMILAEDFGLISARAQGAKKPHSRLRPHLQSFSYGDFSLVHGKAGWKLVGAKALENFFEVFKNSETKLAIAANVLNLVRKLVGEESDTKIFQVVSDFLLFIKNAEEEDLKTAECLVLLKILHALGYMRHDPELALPITSLEISRSDLSLISPRRAQIVALINESLKAI